jgi:hypothetical protein
MTIHSRDDERFGTKEENSMNTYEAYGRRPITFRQAHANNQDVAVVERESFEEHDARMRVFRQNHPDITGLVTVTKRGVNKSMKLAVWSSLIPLESDMRLEFSPN